MANHHRKRHSVLSRQCPPPTAHRLAAWLSVARGLTHVPAKEILFPPNADEILTLQAFWRQRLAALRDAGVEVLKNPRVFEHATACKPHAFSYAGKGKVCRLQFCPFCNAADAAVAYERIRRVSERRKDLGFLLKQTSERVAEDTRLADCLRLPEEDSVRGTMSKWTLFPNERNGGIHVQTVRSLTAVSREQARSVYLARQLLDKAARQVSPLRGYTYAELGLDPGTIVLLHSGCYAVRSSPVSLARAVAHLCQYPSAFFTAPAGEVAAVINRTAGVRMSAVRGIFRDADPLHPQRFPLQCVPSSRDGLGIACELACLLPQPEEGLVARLLSRLLKLPARSSFADVSFALGLPCYWLGKVELSMADLARPSKSSPIYEAVSRHRPAAPGDSHVLVCLTSGLGMVALSTLASTPEETMQCGIDTAVALHVRVRGKKYTLETADSFARRLLCRRAC